MFWKALSNAQRQVVWVAAVCAVTMIPTPARAAFHLWKINEIYSNSSGTLQFIELSTTDSFQNFVTGTSIQVSNTGMTQSNQFMLPPPDLAGDTANHFLLFATAGVQAAGGPAPDYIIPNNFLFTAGGSIGFFGSNGGAYSALPTDGTMSRNWLTGTNFTVNSPTNYGGQSGTVTVPEPTSMLLMPLAAGLCGLHRWVKRRRTAVEAV